MNLLRASLTTASVLLAPAGALQGQFFDAQSGFSVEPLNEEAGRTQFNLNEGTAEFHNGAILRHMGMVLTADSITFRFDPETNDPVEASAAGNVYIQRGGFLWMSESIQYDVDTGRLSGDLFKAGRNPFFLQGESFQGFIEEGSYVANGITLTTDDYSRPAQKIRARTISIDPDNYVEASDATVYLENVPVFYFPWYGKSLESHRQFFVFTPGYRSRFGPYLLTDYNWIWSDQLRTAAKLDWRQKRGFGTGADVEYDLKSAGAGEIHYYYANDDEPGEDSFGDPIDPHRQRFKFRHDALLGEHLTLRSHVRWQDDEFMVRDFFESEYRDNVQPGSWVELQKLWDNYSFNVFAQPQLNTFQETVERLPDIRFTGYRQQLGRSPFYYETQNSLGWYRRQFANDLQPYFSAFRGDSFHQVTMPNTFFGWLNVLPRAGGRFTYYSEAEGPGGDTDEQHRGVFNTGAEVNFKLSRLWKNASSSLLNLDGLRHIARPSVNYVFIPEPSVRPPELPQFDYELTSIRLLPNEFPEYNAIDSIDSSNVLRLGLFNKLQTRRDDQVRNFLQWNLFTDWRLDPRAGQDTFSDFYSVFDFLPREWVILTSEIRLGLDPMEINEANHYLTFIPASNWSWSIGHRYFRENPAFGPDSENNTLINRIVYRLNENWGARLQHHYEGRDGVLEEQVYSIYRDLRSWTGALSFRLRDNRDRDDDFTVAFTLSLKSFPRYDLGEDREHPSLLFGR